MATLFFICLVIAVLHFFYESVILPSLTLKLKYRFDKLKDELIMIAIKKDSDFDIKEYNFTVHNVELLSRNMNNMTLSTMVNAIKFFKENPNVVNNESEITVEKLKNKRLKSIHQDCIKFSFEALVFNSLMWAIYLLPIFIVAHILGTTKRTYKNLIDKLSMTSDSDFNRVINDEDYCAV